MSATAKDAPTPETDALERRYDRENMTRGEIWDLARKLERERERDAARAALRWIPVGERLPEEWPFVVRWNDDVAKDICERYEAINHDPDWDAPSECLDWKLATHWMPLPAAPSAERADKEA